jgi:hypothetical protein
VLYRGAAEAEAAGFSPRESGHKARTG